MEFSVEKSPTGDGLAYFCRGASICSGGLSMSPGVRPFPRSFAHSLGHSGKQVAISQFPVS